MRSIFLRASGVDNNPAGASAFVGVPVPTGTKNGDLVLVGLSVQQGIAVIPPDDGWTMVAQSDPSLRISVVVFWKTALNEAAPWVFALSASSVAAAGVLVYANAESFTPVDAFALQTSDHSVAPGYPACTASIGNEESVLMIATGPFGGALGAVTAPSPFLGVVSRSNGINAGFTAAHRQVQPAGVIPAGVLTAASQDYAAVAHLVLAPNPGTLSHDDAYKRVVGALPPGIDSLLDFTPTGDFFKFFSVLGSIFKIHAFDLYDILRLEVVPYLSRYKLPDWERVFGLLATLTAKTGTVPQRQAQVLSAWRAAAGQGSSLSVIQATIAPLLGYVNAADLVVLEASRSALTAAHSYHLAVDTDVFDASTTVIRFDVRDDPAVAQMGAQLVLAFDSGPPTIDYIITLARPDGISKTWPGTHFAGNGELVVWLQAPELAGGPICGRWTLLITQTSGSDNLLLAANTYLFVEAVGRGIDGYDGRGAQIFDWAVYADHTKVGANGTPPDYAGARAAVKKLSFSHTKGCLVTNASAYASSKLFPPFLPRSI